MLYTGVRRPPSTQHRTTLKELGLRIKKSQFHSPELDKNALPEISPLIAKIAHVAIVYYLLPYLHLIPSADELREHARYAKPLEHVSINWFVPTDDLPTSRHLLMLTLDGPLAILDINLGGSAGWRVVIPCVGPINLAMESGPYAGSNADRVIVILDFKDPTDKKILLGVRKVGEEFSHIEEIDWDWPPDDSPSQD